MTCTYCDTQLKIVSSDGAAYTEALERLEDKAEQIESRLVNLEEQGELERLDREWSMERESLLITNKRGRTYAPSKLMGIGQAVIVTAFGIFWIIMAASIGAPSFMLLFGVVFIGVGIFGSVRVSAMAGKMQRRQREYEQQRRRILDKQG